MTKAVDLVGAKVLLVEILGLGWGGGLLAVSFDFTGLGVLVAAIGTAIAVVIGARSAAKKAEAESARLAVKIEAVSLATEAIKTSVDGASHIQRTEVDVMRAENVMLREMLAKETANAERLAQAAATALATAPAVLATPPAAAEDSLASIDGTTKAIEKNTAKTGAQVQELKDTQDEKGAG